MPPTRPKSESAPEVLRNTCLANNASTRGALEEFRELPDRVIEHLDKDDGERVQTLLREALLYRKSLIGDGQEADG